MRKKKMSAAFVLSVTMSLALLAGCGESTAKSTGTTSASSIYGIVREVDEDSLTIEEGTLKEKPEKPESDGSDKNSDQKQDQESEKDTNQKNTDKQQGQPPQGQPPEGGSGQGQQGQPPEGGSGQGQQGQRPEGDSGQGQQGQPPQGQPPQGGPSGESMLDLSGEEKEISVTKDTVVSSGSLAQEGQETEKKEDVNTSENEVDELSDLKEGDLVSIDFDSQGNASTITVITGKGGPGGSGQGMPGGQSSQPETYSAVTSYDENKSVSNETYASTGTDENALLIENGAKVTVDNPTVTRTSDDSSGGDSASFYGVGAAVLNKEGTTYIKNGTIKTDAAGAAGIFSYGDKSTTYVAGTQITTKEGTSGGIHVAGGGTLYAWDVTAETSGESSAAIRSDRGGGTMVVDGGSYTSNGTGSPAVYTTADITVNKAKLTATNSEAVCIEGLNSLRLYDSTLTGNMPDQDQNDCTWNVILYQSMSGDSQEGNSTFDMEGGKLIAKNGGMFYTTNTESTFVLKDVDIQYADENDFFLKCTGNSNARGWGNTGENGARCTFTGISQEMEGDVIWDSISSLNMYLTEGSSLKGAVIDDESNAGSTTGDGTCSLTISKDSSWTVTGDSKLTTLSSQGKIADEKGNSVTIKGSDGTVYVSGNSEYTITVEEYNDKADLSGASTSSSYTDYKVEKPQALQ